MLYIKTKTENNKEKNKDIKMIKESNNTIIKQLLATKPYAIIFQGKQSWNTQMIAERSINSLSNKEKH